MALTHLPRKNVIKKSLLFLTGLVVATYFYTLNYPFISDDITGIVNQNLSDFSLVTNNPFQFGRNLIYFLINFLVGKVPWAFRLTNLSAQIIVVLAVFLIISLLVNSRAALFSAVLVAVHPVMIESITWISGGGYSSYTALCLISLLFYIVKDKHPIYYWLSVITFLASLIFSEKAVILPGILVIYVLLFEDIKKRWLSLVPFFIMSGIWILRFAGLITVRQTALIANFSNPSQTSVSPFFRFVFSLSSYLGLIVWPDKLSMYHSELIFSVINFCLRIIAIIVYFSLLLYCWYSGIRHHTWIKFPAFWLSAFFISLLPTLVSGGLAWIVAERYVYFGAVCCLSAIGIGIEQWSKQYHRPGLAIIFMCCISTALFIRTVFRNTDWQDQDHLWLAAERTSPYSPQNNSNLGILYASQGNFPKAVMYFTRATQFETCYGDAYYNLALSYVDLNQTDLAIKYFNQAILCKPILWQSHEQLANIYFSQSNFPKALAEIKTALNISPHNTDLQQDEALILQQMNQP